MKYCGEEITLLLSSKCNIRCKHCYISYSGAFDPKIAKSIIEVQKERGFRIDLNGAELLTDLRYLPLFKLTDSDTIMTNGLILYQDKNIYKLLRENGINTVEVSYHFFIHDSISQVPTNIIENVIKELKSRKFNIVLNTVVTSDNYLKVPLMCDIATELGVSRIRFNNFVLQGAAIHHNLTSMPMSQKQIIEFFNIINQLRFEYDKNDLYIERSGLFGSDIRNTNKNNFNCPAIRNDVTITPDFKIYPCFYLAGLKEHQIGVYSNHEIILFENITNHYYTNNCFSKDLLNKDYL